ncbi:MAG: type II toxin-antitoxin system VapC family toxin [Planctomycetota bacterium]|nr:type II toxin-antitoxin system VapC family toxin [Planctomycetota bacterium]
MILLDTDHLSVLTDPRHALRVRLLDRLQAYDDLVALPLPTVEEQLRGWLALIHRVTDVHRQIVPYRRLAKLMDFLSDWTIIPWDEPAADTFRRLRASRVRIGTQDLKIASTAIVHDALLLSANLRDYEQVPGLQVEDWLYGR